ncbi:hypothetical protein M422DRAFT_242438 [Sphaerobolus stellatus SS14]|nr:hypothetical protein M422DRAFT_242438 [Sphaerobolus stellatus SS14]
MFGAKQHLAVGCGFGSAFVQAISKPRGKITAIACSADGETMVSGSEDGTVWLRSLVKFDFEDLQVHASDRSPITCLSYSRGDKLLAAAPANGTIYTWNSEDLLPLGNAIRGPQGITALCISQGQRFLWALRTERSRWSASFNSLSALLYHEH